jgi:hypothetical protein
MKKVFWINYVIFTAILLFLTTDCKKEEPPTIPVLSTAVVGNVTESTATCGGNITSDGRSAIIIFGVCWSTSAKPTINNDSKTVSGLGTGPFTISIDGLTGGTAYWVRAYATNSVGTAYGNDITFTTLGQAPTAITDSTTNISGTTATLNGIVNANYLPTTVTFEYGTTASYGSTVTAIQGEVTGNNSTNVSADISVLTPNTDYHFRIKAVNNLGTVYGDDITFITLLGVQAPIVSTNSATNISSTGATLNGTVNANSLSTTVTFEYDSTITNYGNSVTALQSLATGDSITKVSADISGLTPGVTYHFRVKAEYSDGVSYGDDIQFQLFKCDQVPAVTTVAATQIDQFMYTLYGTVNANNFPATVTFTYLLGVHHGKWNYRTVSAVPDIVTGDSITHVSTTVGPYPRSEANTRPFWVSATNECGTTTGNIMSIQIARPTATTEPATNISATGATLNGTVNANNLSTTVTFEYGTTTSYGSTITASQSPVIGNSTTNVSADISGLTTKTCYHFRVAAINYLAVNPAVYGDDRTFTTP